MASNYARVQSYAPIIQDAANEWNVDPTLIAAVMHQESGGNPAAVSPAGARGLMQIMPGTARGLGVTDPHDPEQSIFGGAKYLSQMLDQFGDPARAVAAYNAGPGKARAVFAGRDTFRPETTAYTPAVASHYRGMSGQSAAAGGETAAALDRIRGGQVTNDGQQQQQQQPADDVEAFLKRTGAATSQPSPAAKPADQGEGVDDFLKRTGAVAAAPTAAPVAANPPYDPFITGGSGGPDATPSYGMGGTNPDLPPTPLARALKDGPDPAPVMTGSGQTVRPAPFENGLRSYLQHDPTVGEILPIGGASDPATGELMPNRLALPNMLRDIGLGALDLLHGPETGTVSPDATNALMAGIGSPAMGMSSVARGTGGAIANRLVGQGWREVAPVLPEAFTPLAGPGPLNRLAMREAGPSEPIPAMAGTKPDAMAPVASPVAPAPEPSPGMGAPGPQSVGAAAASPGEANMTAAQIQAYRATADGQKLLEPQPREADPNIYVPGVNPTLAQVEQQASSARKMKMLAASDPAAAQQVKDVAAEHSSTRQRYFQDIAGSPVDVANAQAAVDAKTEASLGAVWAGKKPVDPAPVQAAADQILASPDGRRPAVRNVINSVANELTGADGKPITDPEQLYGVRKHINDLLSREGQRDNPLSVRATANLMQMKTALDGTIEQGAPGFGKAMADHAEGMRPIDTMTALQGHETGLYGSQNRMEYARVQRMMKQIVDSQNAPGVNSYKSIPPETMTKLWNLRDDLRRAASADELAKAPGSDTTSLLADMARGTAKVGGNLAAHAIAGATTGGIGNILLETAGRPMMNNLLAKRAGRQRQDQMNKLLYPDPSLYRPAPGTD